MEYNSAIKKDEILPFAVMWMDLENIMLVKQIRHRHTTTVESKSNTNEYI